MGEFSLPMVSRSMPSLTGVVGPWQSNHSAASARDRIPGILVETDLLENQENSLTNAETGGDRNFRVRLEHPDIHH